MNPAATPRHPSSGRWTPGLRDGSHRLRGLEVWSRGAGGCALSLWAPAHLLCSCAALPGRVRPVQPHVLAQQGGFVLGLQDLRVRREPTLQKPRARVSIPRGSRGQGRLTVTSRLSPGRWLEKAQASAPVVPGSGTRAPSGLPREPRGLRFHEPCLEL